MPTAQVSESTVTHDCSLVVEVAEMWKNQAADNERVHDGTARRPMVQTLQQREVITRNVVTGEVIGTRQVCERVDNLYGSVLGNLIAVEVGDYDTMHHVSGV